MTQNNSKSYEECIGAIPSKISYIPNGKSNKTNEIYYFGTPPKKPGSLSNYLKLKKNNGGK